MAGQRLLALALPLLACGCDFEQKGPQGAPGAVGPKDDGTDGATGPIGPAGLPGPQGEQGEPSPTLRVIRMSCLHNATSAAGCRRDEVLIAAYCGPSRNMPTYVNEQQVSCSANADVANTPLVVICAAAP
jgi:hypothetical protein